MRKSRPATEIKRLRKENRALRRDLRRARKRIALLEDAVVRFKKLWEDARRAGKRQAAPFSKGPPKKNPRRPGRKPGPAHGKPAWRPIPSEIDETVDASLPTVCDRCGGDVEQEDVQFQFQTEIPPVRPRVTRIRVPIGRCRRCGRRVCGRHPRQTSSALGAAAAQLGPSVLALAAHLHIGLGLPFGKISVFFQTHFGLCVSRGGLSLALHRLARAAEPTYQAFQIRIRKASVVAADETGWRVEGWSAWLWVFVTRRITVYTIRPGRGFEEAAEILGPEYDGNLLRDGWAPYRRFLRALHQSCLSHLLHRCEENLQTAERGTARFPHAVARLLQDALLLRDRRDQNLLSPHGLLVARGRLQTRCDRLLSWNPSDEENDKFLRHLQRERDALFTFLDHPEVEATNWPAEQAIRPAVVTRKVCGGNRSWRGAHTQEVLMSLLRTCRQQAVDFYPLIDELLRSPTPQVARILCEETRSQSREPPSPKPDLKTRSDIRQASGFSSKSPVCLPAGTAVGTARRRKAA